MLIDKFIVLAIMGAFIVGYAIGYYFSIAQIIVKVREDTIHSALKKYFEIDDEDIEDLDEEIKKEEGKDEEV